MCGLLGAFSSKPLPEKKRLQRARVIEGLLIANAARGTDASGLAAIGEQRIIYKRAFDSFKFVDDPKARKLARADSALLIGHTRMATHGSHSDDNAHPFQEGHIIGAHNGIISNYSSLDGERRASLKIESKDYDYARVDSQVVFRLLSDGKGPEDYLKILKRVSGNAALVWADDRDAVDLWMVAHDNPLSVAWVPSLDTIFWSSQYDHLSSVLQSQFGKTWFSVPLKRDTLYRFTRGDLLKNASWKADFAKGYSTYTYPRWSDEEWEAKRAAWRAEDAAKHSADGDMDKDVTHPYEVVSISKAKPDPKDNSVAAIIRRMGIPFEDEDALDASRSGTTGSDTSTDGDFVELPINSTCAVCQEYIDRDDTPTYNWASKEWVCGPCVQFWRDSIADGDTELSDRLLPMVI